VVMPASPAFYTGATTVEQMVDFMAGRVLDVAGVEDDLYVRWTGQLGAGRNDAGQTGVDEIMGQLCSHEEEDMKLTQEFQVGIPIEEAWDVLTDLERIARCLPGASLTEVVGDEYHGQVKVKVGPIISQYAGTARFIERDPVTYRAVVEASGRDAKGGGNASATITAALRPSGGVTMVEISTDLQVTGKVAQFGRGIMADVSATLMGQFADRLEADINASQPQHTVGKGAPTSSKQQAAADRHLPPSEDDGAVDLFSLAGRSLMKRAVPVVGVLLVLVLLLLVVRRKPRYR
jgi:carbon monoxide dehydrogenase subunit G